MPTVTLNKTAFEELVGKKLPEDKLKERISMLGTDLEGIEGDEIHVEIFPDRPDMLSEQGFARAFSSFIGEKTGLRKYDIKSSGHKVIVDPSVSMRPYTACCIVKNLDLSDEKIREIMQAQEKLAKTHGRNRKKSAYGVYPATSINFPVTYIAKDPKKVMFWGLEMEGPMPASEVEEKHPKAKEYRHIADDWEKYPFFIDAKDNVMCFLPYTNSHDTGKIEIDTKEVFIECTGADFNNVMTALNIFATMFAEMGGEIRSIDVVYKDKTVTTPDLTPQETDLDIAEVNKLLGLNLTEKEIKGYLERMGHEYKGGKAFSPAYRADILHPWDIIEDIAIAYGFENFTEEIPKVATIGEEDKEAIFIRRIAHVLSGLGLLEVSNYHLGNLDEFNKKMQTEVDTVELANALTEEYSVIRSWILPCLMKTLIINKHHELPHNMYEVGTVATHTDDGNIKEEKHLAVACCDTIADYTYAKQIIDYLFSNLGLEYTIEPADHPSFIQGRAGKVIVNKKEVAHIGEISPAVLENWQLENPVAAFEINLTDLQECMLNEKEN